MARIIITVLCFCFPVLTQAQQLPEAPNPKPGPHAVFYIGSAALAAAKSFDAWTTRDLLDRGGFEAANSELGHYPSTRRLIGIAAADFAVEDSIFYFTEHNRRVWVRWGGRAFVGFLIEQHVRLGFCNAGINTHSSTVHTCH